MTTDEKNIDLVKSQLCGTAIFIMGNWNADDGFDNLKLKCKEVATILDSLYELYDMMTDDERENVEGIIKTISTVVNTKKHKGALNDE